jgi:hypothetical protein
MKTILDDDRDQDRLLAASAQRVLEYRKAELLPALLRAKAATPGAERCSELAGSLEEMLELQLGGARLRTGRWRRAFPLYLPPLTCASVRTLRCATLSKALLQGKKKPSAE